MNGITNVWVLKGSIKRNGSAFNVLAKRTNEIIKLPLIHIAISLANFMNIHLTVETIEELNNRFRLMMLLHLFFCQ